MKYWRGYLVALIVAAISWALLQFAQAHTVLVDMIYPYVTRLIISSVADWSGNFAFNLWQIFLMALIAAGIVSVVLMIILKWNPIQWFGWVMAVISLFSLCQTALYGLNAFTSPLADDMRLEIVDFTVTELNDATVYFRDQANAMAAEVQRDAKGNPDFGSFEELAAVAGQGYTDLTYEQAISVFAGSTAPVKKLSFSSFYSGTGAVIVPITGEASVNPNVPSVALPFTMCKAIAQRMSIYDEGDAEFAAFLACLANENPAFKYSAYLVAYRQCHAALASLPTTTAKACAEQTDAGVSQQLRHDLDAYNKFFGKPTGGATVRTTAATVPTEADPDAPAEVIFAEYAGVADLLASWYMEQFVIPLYVEEVEPFDPFDPAQVGLAPAAG